MFDLEDKVTNNEKYITKLCDDQSQDFKSTLAEMNEIYTKITTDYNNITHELNDFRVRENESIKQM